MKKNKTVVIDTESDPGSWEDALKYSENIRVIGEDEEKEKKQ